MGQEFSPSTHSSLKLELRATERRIAEHEGAIKLLKTKAQNLRIRIGAIHHDSTTPPQAA
jgi:hypothetical protein